MAFSKVILNNETLMDVTSDTVNASNLLSGNTATAASGQKVTGTLTINDFVITLTQNQTSGDWEPDCTFAEALAAYNAGKNIVFFSDVCPVIGGCDSNRNLFWYTILAIGEDEYGTSTITPTTYSWTGSGITYNEDYPYYDVNSSMAFAQPSDVLSGETFFNTSGYQTGTIATKTSSDLTASGATVTAPAGYYSSAASKSVASGSATTPATTVTANPSITVNSSGLITATASATKSVTPTVSAGYVSSGTAGTITVSGSNTSQLITQAAKTVTPSTSSQTAVAAGRYTTGAVTVAAMPSGTAGTPTATKGTVSNHSVSVTPSVTNSTGYITGGTKSGTAITVSASELVSGTLSITENGEGIDVTNYASVDVDVSSGATDPYPFYNDGKDRVYIEIASLEYPTFGCGIYTSASGVVEIDWGDGSDPEEITSTYNASLSHTYTATGIYVITATRLTTGTFRFTGFSSTSSRLTESEYIDSSRVLAAEISLGASSYLFTYCKRLEKVALWNNLKLCSYMFCGCYKLRDITITAMDSSIGGAFRECNSISTLDLSGFTTTIAINKSISTFEHMDTLVSVKLPPNLAGVGQNCFANCSMLQEIDSVGNVGVQAFEYCYALKKVTFKNNITSIGNNGFLSCSSLSTLTIPSSVTSIGNSAFADCTGMKEYHFLSTTPPTLGTDAFRSIPTDCIIYVPVGTLSAYQSATNWATYASYMREEA